MNEIDLLRQTHRVCAEVRMDSLEDQALHDEHVRQVGVLIDSLAARLAAVKALHRKGGMGLRCEPFCLGCHRAWPCPTAIAADPSDEAGT